MAKNKKKNKKMRCNPFLWWFYTFCSKIFLFFKHHIRYDRKVFQQRNKKEGCVVIYNHCSTKDHFITTATFNYHRANYVITKHFYFNPTLKKVLNLVHAIPREQFKSDLISIRNMKKAIDEKGIVAIAPAGQIAVTGEMPYIDKAIVKLVKFCKVDVYASQIYGAYLAYPKWSRTKRNFPLHTKMVKVLSKEEITKLSDEEIYYKITESIQINDRTEQKKRPIVIKSDSLIEGLESIIYYCPKCKSYHTFQTSGNIMTCTKCQNQIRMNSYGFLEGVNNESVYFENETEWYNYEKSLIRKKILHHELHIEGDYMLKRNVNEEWILEEVGSGKLTLTNQSFCYDGIICGQEVHKEFNLETMIQLPFSPAERLDIPDDEGTFEFHPLSNPNQVIEFVQAIDVMRELRQNQVKW